MPAESRVLHEAEEEVERAILVAACGSEGAAGGADSSVSAGLQATNPTTCNLTANSEEPPSTLWQQRCCHVSGAFL